MTESHKREMKRIKTDGQRKYLKSITCATWNIDKNWEDCKEDITEIMEENKINILCLQEVARKEEYRERQIDPYIPRDAKRTTALLNEKERISKWATRTIHWLKDLKTKEQKEKKYQELIKNPSNRIMGSEGLITIIDKNLAHFHTEEVIDNKKRFIINILEIKKKKKKGKITKIGRAHV